MIKTFLIIFAVFSLNLTAAEIGSTAADFTGKTLDGKEIKLSDFKGKVVFLDFWASWCGPCKKAMPFLVDFYNEFKQNDFVIIGVNTDTREKNVKKFLDCLDKQPAFPIIFDNKGKIPPLYKIEGMPTSVLIDKKGNIRFIHTGFEEDMKDMYKKEVKSLLNEK